MRDGEFDVIARWLAAYAKAHPSKPAPCITVLPRGWYEVEGRPTKYRLRNFLNSTQFMETMNA